MSTHSRARMRASPAIPRVMAAMLLFGLGPTLSPAHEGHDHGPPEGAPGQPSPRVIATSEHYQFVGIVEGEVLVIYLDRASDNAPVTTAALEVAVDGSTRKAELQRSGTYEITAPELKTPGSHEVLVTLTDGPVNDLLIGAVSIPLRDQVHGGGSSKWGRLVASANGTSSPTRAAGAMLALGLLAGLALPRRRITIALAVGLGLLVVAASAFAHEGHDHGADMSASAGNAPSRRPDGAIFLPKPSQRLLEIRTRAIGPTTQRRAASLTGRILSNPNFSGVVQTTIQGRYQAPPDGVPALGTKVAAGDLLGSVAPSFASIDASDMSQRLG